MFKKSFGFLIGALILAGTAQAQTHYYSFTVQSSGAGIYACNAGVRAQLNNCDTCYQIKTNGETESVARPAGCPATAATCGQDIICAHRGSNSGEGLMNYFLVSSGAMDNNGAVGPMSKNPAVKGGATYSTLVSENAAFLTKMGNDLEFKLTTELYNAQYFVDICFRGPQINTGADGVKLNYNIFAAVGSTEINGVAAASYAASAGLKSQAFVICDLNAASTASSNIANFSTGSNGLPTNGWSSGAIDVSTAMYEWQNVPSVYNPKFCKVRYVFTETKGTNCANGKPAFRDMGLKSAAICLRTDFNEPE